MATIFYKAGGAFSTLTPQKVVAFSWAPNMSEASAGTDIGTVRTQEFTPNEAGDCEGVFIALSTNGAFAAGTTVTVKLQQYSGGAWGDVAGATVTATQSDILSTHSGYVAGYLMGHYFELGTAAAVTSGASTWRWWIQASASGQVYLRSGYSYGVVLTATTSYSSGDNIVFRDGQVFTIDQSITATTVATGVNTHLVWDSTPAASYTLTVTSLYWSRDLRLEVGDSTNRIPYAQQAIINIANHYFGVNYAVPIQNEISLYGEKPTSYYTTLASNAAASQKIITTTDDMSASWVATDVIDVLGANSLNVGYESPTISSISGTSITTVANLTYLHYADFVVWNFTRASRCGIKLNGTGSMAGGQFHTWKVSGVFVDSGCVMLQCTSYGAIDTTRFTPYEIDTLIMQRTTTLGPNLVSYAAVTAVTTAMTGTHYQYIFMRQGDWGNSKGLTIFNGTIDHIYAGNLGANATFYISYALNSTISNIQSGGSGSGTYDPLLLSNCVNCTFTDMRICGGAGGYRIYGTFILNTFTRCHSDKATSNVSLTVNTIDTVFEDCEWGNKSAGTNNIDITSSTYQRVIVKNCILGSTNDVNNYSGMTLGSYIKIDTNDQVANNHTCYFKYGVTQSTGAGLTDTTCHTADGLAIRYKPENSTNSLNDWQFTIPTGNIQNKTMIVGIWCKIASANYYSGTHQLPRLTIDYDDGTITYVQATETTDWQLLQLPFTPITAYGQITVSLSARTGAITTNAYVYFDDIVVTYPTSHTLDSGSLDYWTDALPMSPPISLGGSTASRQHITLSRYLRASGG